MDTSKTQALSLNVLVRKSFLNRLKILKKLSVYEKYPHLTITWRSFYFTIWDLQKKANS